jgi:hypothetical protein
MPTTSLFLFAIQGQVFTSQKNNIPRKEHNAIKVTNLRNSITDADIVGEGAGSFSEAGWYTLTLADLQNDSAAMVGDVLEFALYTNNTCKTKLLDLGRHVITDADMDMAGVIVNFDLEGKL